MPKLELLQWSDNYLLHDPIDSPMARRTEQGITDRSSSPGDDTVDDVFKFRLIHHSHALARFQHRPGRGGTDRAEGWDRKYEYSNEL